MARSKRPTGDQATNARKRYYRAAERYLKQSQTAAPAEAARLRALAQLRLDDAFKTYSKSTTQTFSKPMQRIANELGVDLSAERRKIKDRSAKEEKELRAKAISEEQSRRAKVSEVTPETLREGEARALLNSPIGRRIIGGTVEIWEDAARVTLPDGSTKIDKTKILPALFKYFVVDKLSDLLDKIQDIVGELLFRNEDKDTMYESAKITIQTYVKSQRNA